MSIPTSVFLASLLSVATLATRAQKTHTEDSLLYDWMKNMEHQSRMTYDQLQRIEQDSVDKVLAIRGTNFWHYPGTDKQFYAATSNEVLTPHDSAWVSEQNKQLREQINSQNKK